MGRRKRHRKQAPVDPQSVIEGRTSVDVAQLFSLIHRVNPTGRDAPPAEQARQYATKNRLQEILVRRFGADLEVVADPDEPDIVSIRRRHFPQDATHAVVADLADDVRSWIWNELDTQTGPVAAHAHAGSPAPVTPSPADALQQGLAALDEYDYDRAGQLLDQAFRQSSGTADAAVALLGLLVDHLADFDSAIALEGRLSAAAQADPEVRLLLALAAAHAGQTERARQLLRDTRHPRLHEAWVALARTEIVRGDRAAARDSIEALRALDPGHGSLPDLESRLEEARSDERAGLEQDLVRLHDQGQLDEAEDVARSLLARWPDCSVARTVLSQVEEQRLASRLTELSAAARACEAEGDVEQALETWELANRLAPDRADVAAALARVRRDVTEQRQQAQIEDVLRGLAGNVDERVLVLYLDLPGPAREDVARQTDSPLIAWLEATGVSATNARSGETVTAILALGRAAEAARTGRPADVLAELEPVAGLLRSVPEATRLLSDATAAEVERRASEVADQLTRAGRALDRGDLRTAARLLQGIEPEGLDRTQRGRLEILEVSLNIERRLGDARAEYRRLRSSDDLLAARKILGGPLDRKPDPVAWAKEWRELREEIRRSWRQHVWRSSQPAPLAWPMPTLDLDGPCLDSERGVVVLTRAHGRWLFVHRIDVKESRSVERLVLRTPGSMSPVDTWLDASSIWMAGDAGRLLRLDLGTRDILSWQVVTENLGDRTVVDHHVLDPDGEYLWCDTRSPERMGGDAGWLIVELRSNRARTTRCDANWIGPVRVGERPMIVAQPWDEPHIQLWSADGGRQVTDRIGLPGPPMAVAVHPDDERLVVLTADDEVEMASFREGLLALVVDLQGECGPPCPLPGFDRDSTIAMATSLDQGLTYVRAGRLEGDQDAELLAFRPAGQGLELQWRCAVPERFELARDPGSHQVCAAWETDRGVRVAPLGPVAPRFGPPPAPSHPPMALPVTPLRHTCTWPVGAVNATALAHAARLSHAPVQENVQWLRKYIRMHRADPDLMFALAVAHDKARDRAKGLQIARDALADHPAHPGLALLIAQDVADHGHYDEALHILGRVEPEAVAAMDPASACHFHHVLGVAQLGAGQPDRALDTLCAGADMEDGGCELVPWIALAEPLPDPLEPHHWDRSQPLLGQLRGAIVTLDRQLEQGEIEAALQTLDLVAFWRSRECQFAARRARAFLAAHAQGKAGEFETALATTSFLETMTEPELGGRFELLLPQGRIGEDELQGIAGECEEWLERF